MKKLLASGCCVLALQSFSQVSPCGEAHEQFAGRRVLIKAIAVIVNTNAHSEVPPKRICPPNLESPRG